MRDATRNLLTVAGVVAAIAIAVTAFGGNRKRIEQARAESLVLAAQRDSLLGVVAQRETEWAQLAARADTFHTQAQVLRDSIGRLEQERADAQLGVRRIRTVGALQTRLRQAFPELGKSGWGVTHVPVHQGDTIGIEYLMVPAWFAETFVIDHENAKSWRAQKDRLLAVDSLRLTVIALQDSITRLVQANADAYESGYQAAYASYQDLSKRHIAELKKPRIRLGSALGLLGATGLGVVIWSAIHD